MSTASRLSSIEKQLPPPAPTRSREIAQAIQAFGPLLLKMYPDHRRQVTRFNRAIETYLAGPCPASDEPMLKEVGQTLANAIRRAIDEHTAKSSET
jgi:hypothetical protein